MEIARTFFRRRLLGSAAIGSLAMSPQASSLAQERPSNAPSLLRYHLVPGRFDHRCRSKQIKPAGQQPKVLRKRICLDGRVQLVGREIRPETHSA